jgi:putative ubiquitin-RnfH superfamily antitoxin RatB of RatAB toxin-antitoxin module
LAVEAPASVVAGATVLEAIRASGLLEQFPELDVSSLTVGIWGRPCLLDAGLNAGDRVEIYRPLAMDPKEARRLRAQGQRGTSRR